MTASVCIPSTESCFRCGSFSEEDVVDDRYTITLDLECYDKTNSSYPSLHLFVIGKGPYHLSDPSTLNPYDLILFGVYASGNDLTLSGNYNYETRTACSAINRSSEQFLRTTEIKRKSYGTTDKIEVTILFKESKEFPRTGYEYRYLAWSFVSSVRPKVMKVPDPDLEPTSVHVVNNLLHSRYFRPFGEMHLNTFYENTSGGHRNFVCSQPNFPPIIYNSESDDFVYIVRGSDFSSTGMRVLNIYWPWLGRTMTENREVQLLWLGHGTRVDRLEKCVATFDPDNEKIAFNGYNMIPEDEHDPCSVYCYACRFMEDITDG